MAQISHQLAVAAGLAIASGVMVTFQPAINGQLAQRLGTPLQAAVISFGAGTTALLLALAIMRPAWPTRAELSTFPPYLWVAGGVLGAFFVTAAAWSTPRVGVGVYLSILVASQLTMALIIDHFGLAGMEVRDVSWSRIGGVVLLTFGAVLVTRG